MGYFLFLSGHLDTLVARGEKASDQKSVQSWPKMFQFIFHFPPLTFKRSSDASFSCKNDEIVLAKFFELDFQETVLKYQSRSCCCWPICTLVKAISKSYTSPGGSSGLVVMRGYSCPECCGCESQHLILDGHFFTYICYKNCTVCLKTRKRGRGWPIFKKSYTSERKLIKRHRQTTKSALVRELKTPTNLTIHFGWLIRPNRRIVIICRVGVGCITVQLVSTLTGLVL